jgi:hypothetical protein
MESLAERAALRKAPVLRSCIGGSDSGGSRAGSWSGWGITIDNSSLKKSFQLRVVAEIGPTREISLHLESDIASRNQNTNCLTDDFSSLPHDSFTAAFAGFLLVQQDILRQTNSLLV